MLRRRTPAPKAPRYVPCTDNPGCSCCLKTSTLSESPTPPWCANGEPRARPACTAWARTSFEYSVRTRKRASSARISDDRTRATARRTQEQVRIPRTEGRWHTSEPEPLDATTRVSRQRHRAHREGRVRAPATHRNPHHRPDGRTDDASDDSGPETKSTSWRADSPSFTTDAEHTCSDKAISRTRKGDQSPRASAPLHFAPSSGGLSTSMY